MNVSCLRSIVSSVKLYFSFIYCTPPCRTGLVKFLKSTLILSYNGRRQCFTAVHYYIRSRRRRFNINPQKFSFVVYNDLYDRVQHMYTCVCNGVDHVIFMCVVPTLYFKSINFNTHRYSGKIFAI